MRAIIALTSDRKAREFDDLLDSIFCAYLVYYCWYWGEEGTWVIGDVATGYVTVPRCRLKNCPSVIG